MSEIDELKAEMAALRKEVQKLASEVDALKTTSHFSLADLKRLLPGMIPEEHDHQAR